MFYSATIHWSEERNALWRGRRKFYVINPPTILISLALDDVTLLNVRNKLLAGFLDVMAAREVAWAWPPTGHRRLNRGSTKDPKQSAPSFCENNPFRKDVCTGSDLISLVGDQS